ncbi:hypothetical protein NZ30_06345 [Xanthomonas translucens pv. undulosa]|nr:hypothetical protein NZ30_06345 [Xanthomonas translucens pv. undulosa]
MKKFNSVAPQILKIILHLQEGIIISQHKKPIGNFWAIHLSKYAQLLSQFGLLFWLRGGKLKIISRYFTHKTRKIF